MTVKYRTRLIVLLAYIQKEQRKSAVPFSACRNYFSPRCPLFSELCESSENVIFQWCGETGKAPPVADKASLFRGRLPTSGYAGSAGWLEPTVYPLLGYLRAKSRLTAVALRNAPAGAVPHTLFPTAARNLSLSIDRSACASVYAQADLNMNAMYGRLRRWCSCRAPAASWCRSRP